MGRAVHESCWLAILSRVAQRGRWSRQGTHSDLGTSAAHWG